MEILYGALGALMVLLALILGLALGWKARDMLKIHRSVRTENEEEKHRAWEEQQAFEHMLHYNMDTAYGMNAGIGDLTGGDGR